MISAKITNNFLSAKICIRCLLVGFLIFSVFFLQVFPQSDNDGASDLKCKVVSFLTTAFELQKDFYNSYLNPLTGDPNFPSISAGGPDDLSTIADQYLDSCVSSSNIDFCGKYKSYKSQGVASFVVSYGFTVDSDSCAIKDKNGETVDAIYDKDGNPITEDGRVLKGYDGAIWKSQYNIAETFHDRWESLKGSRETSRSFKDWKEERENGKFENY